MTRLFGRLLCAFGSHRWVGTTTYIIEPFPGYRPVFHKDVCKRCNLVRERYLPPLSPGEDVAANVLFETSGLKEWLGEAYGVDQTEEPHDAR